MTLRSLGAVVPPILTKLQADLNAKGVDVGPLPPCLTPETPTVNHDTITDRVRKIVAEHFTVPLEEIKPTSHLYDDLASDSLDAIELTISLEEEFDLEIPDDVAERFQTVADIIGHLEPRAAVAA